MLLTKPAAPFAQSRLLCLAFHNKSELKLIRIQISLNVNNSAYCLMILMVSNTWKFGRTMKLNFFSFSVLLFKSLTRHVNDIQGILIFFFFKIELPVEIHVSTYLVPLLLGLCNERDQS